MLTRSRITLSAPGLSGAPGLRRLWQLVLAFSAARRQRKALSRLDDHLLCDIGLSRHDAEAEADRSVWDAPLHWRG